MRSILKVLVVGVTLTAGTGAAMAGAEGTYHWGYPDNLKNQPNVPVQSLGVESGIPPLYR
jgi:hypothetical protein